MNFLYKTVNATSSAPKTAALSHRAVVNVWVEAELASLMSDLEWKISERARQSGQGTYIRRRRVGWGRGEGEGKIVAWIERYKVQFINTRGAGWKS